MSRDPRRRLELEFDPEIERTLREHRREVRNQRRQTMADPQIDRPSTSTVPPQTEVPQAPNLREVEVDDESQSQGRNGNRT